ITDRPNQESQTAIKPACTPGFLAKSITCSGQIIAIDQSLPNSSRTTKYLTDNYTWCERFFCSHPGPTLPNRMLSLTRDLQYDRSGEAILENNLGDDFALSRAMSIFDLLTRKGIGWRVYESFPSVAMLRMFARYATDTEKIVNVADPPNSVNVNRLKQDVLS